MKIRDTKVLLIISAVPTQIGVTVFLIYGLCTQDVTAAGANMCQEATDQEVRAADVRTKAKNCRNDTAPWNLDTRAC